MREARRGKKTSGFHMSSSSLHNDDDSSSVYWRGLLFSNLLFHTVIFMVCVSQLCYSGCTDRKNMYYLQNPKKQPLSSSSFSPIFQYICEFFVVVFLIPIFFKFSICRENFCSIKKLHIKVHNTTLHQKTWFGSLRVK